MIKYLEEILGVAPDIVSLEKKRIQGLPQFLAKAYKFLGCTLFGCSLVIAKPIAEDDLVTPGEFTRHVIRQQEHFKMPVVLFFGAGGGISTESPGAKRSPLHCSRPSTLLAPIDGRFT